MIMLEAVSDVHDCHTELLERNSTAELAAARNDGKVHLILAASGSVATIKLPNIINALARHRNLSIRIILTASAAHFLAGQAAEQPSISALQLLPNVDAVYQDSHEWMPQWRRGAPILHIELRRWCDLLVIAPLSMNTLASIVAGLCNNLLLSVVRAWDTNGKIDGQKKRILVAPVSLPIQSYGMILLNLIKAANTAMWNHPITASQIKVLEEWGWFDVLRPQEKILACNDVGDGALRDWQEIVKIIEEKLNLDSYQFSGERLEDELLQ